MADLDELLREDGAAWRSEVDAQRSLGAFRDAGHAGRRRRVRRSRAPVVAALTTVILAIGIAYVSTRGDGNTRNTALPTLSTSGTTRDRLRPVPSSEITAAKKRAQAIPTTSATRGAMLLSMHWQFVALLDGGRTILVSYAAGDGCDRTLGFHVQQGSNAVELTALSQVDHGSCTQPLNFLTGTITLDRPLGSRALLHATTDRH
jgi:hypothetical protein